MRRTLENVIAVDLSFLRCLWCAKKDPFLRSLLHEPTPWFIQLDPVRERGDEIAAELAVLLESGQMATSTRIPALGVAHGWAGFAFALLRWARATGKTPHPAAAAALDELAAMAEPRGSGVRWPVHNATSAPIVYGRLVRRNRRVRAGLRLGV
jgi:hypothetical protein